MYLCPVGQLFLLVVQKRKGKGIVCMHSRLHMYRIMLVYLSVWMRACVYIYIVDAFVYLSCVYLCACVCMRTCMYIMCACMDVFVCI